MKIAFVSNEYLRPDITLYEDVDSETVSVYDGKVLFHFDGVAMGVRLPEYPGYVTFSEKEIQYFRDAGSTIRTMRSSKR